jgi:hypothetical protein
VEDGRLAFELVSASDDDTDDLEKPYSNDALLGWALGNHGFEITTWG